MEYKILTECRRFSEEKMQKVPLFESGKMFYDLYCLLPGQFQKVHTHANEDKVYVVLEGEGTFEIGGEQRTLSAGSAVIARAGESHGVKNDTNKNLVLLVTMAPRPR